MENESILKAIQALDHELFTKQRPLEKVIKSHRVYLIKQLEIAGVPYKAKQTKDYISEIMGDDEYGRIKLRDLVIELSIRGIKHSSVYVKGVCEQLGYTVRRGARNCVYVYRGDYVYLKPIIRQL